MLGISQNFAMVKRKAVQPITLGNLAAMLEATGNKVYLTHKFVGPGYSTTAYDETTKTFYRAAHTNGVSGLWKHISRVNKNVQVLERDERYTPGESK